MTYSPSFTLSTEILQEYGALVKLRQKIGNTPLLRLLTPDDHACVYAKCEWFNEGGTVKARVAFAMLWKLLSEVPKDKLADITILEYTGGTLGLCLAQYCHLLKINLVLVLSESTPPSMLKQLKKLNARVILVAKEKGFYGVMEEAKALSEQNPHWQFLYQHINEANPYIHYNTTGQEIYKQLNGRKVDAWVASIGTGGTLNGVYHRLSEHFPDLKMYSTTPAEMPYGTPNPPNSLPKFSGSGGLGYSKKQPFVEPIDSQVTEHFTVPYEECIQIMAKFRRDTGKQIGSSSAANLKTAMNLAKEIGPEGVVVTVFPCAGNPEEWQRIDKEFAEKKAESSEVAGLCE